MGDKRKPEARPRKDKPWNPPVQRADISTTFVLFAAGPLLLPVLGSKAGAIAWAAALPVIGYAAIRSWLASRRAPRRRAVWLALALGAGLAAAGASLALLAEFAGAVPASGYHLAAGGSLGILAATLLLATRAAPFVRAQRAVDALLIALVVVAGGAYFVAVPALERGETLLAVVFGLDLAALVVASVVAVAWDGHLRRVALSLLAAVAFVTAADAVTAGAAGSRVIEPSWIAGLLWAAAGAAVALAAGFESGRSERAARSDPDQAHLIYARVLLPLAAVLAPPAMAVAEWLTGDLTGWGAAYFGAVSLALVCLAFGRQAQLLVENHRVAIRERGLREQVSRRNEELEALTELASTMAQTLDEDPIVERGLSTLHIAARSTSAALHCHTADGVLELIATAGDWQGERQWAPAPTPGAEPELHRRGAREIVILPLVAREQPIGTVTLVRPQSQPFGEDDLALLRVLTDQLAVAVQNARDYREKLEQAVRDPLTGLYNRRYFFEALDKEVKRTRRYSGAASLVIFDVDDFKGINDSLGHAAGDHALRAVAAIASECIREVDSFARIGGEEFALLLPETHQLDALLVAERIRAAVSREEMLPGRRVTVSGGVASAPLDASTAEELERAADRALYWAKGSGKNMCALASEATVRAPAEERHGMLAHLHAVVAAIDAKHLKTRDHSENVAAYAVAIGQELGLDADRLVRLRRAALFHDIGKVAVDADVLGKPGALDPDELERVRLHPVVGAAMLAHAGLVEEAGWVRSHHERVDGRGYPDGLAGDAIPLEARILFVADAFEAITADRPHRGAATIAEAREELRREAGTQFDPEVVAALDRLLAEDGPALLALRMAQHA